MRLWSGNAPEQTRLYAGNPVVSGATGRETSDNASGADNQQERPGRSRLRNPQRPYAELPSSSVGMKIWSTPYGDIGTR